MVIDKNLCASCVQTITNPICPECFSKHVLNWVRDYNLASNKIGIIRKKIDSMVREYSDMPANISCIICGSKKVNLCTYCFTNKASIIVKKNAEKQIVENFKEDFNTLIWKVPYQ